MGEKPEALLGLDIGTTHCKAGLFAEDGTALCVARRAMAVQHAPEGLAYFDPEETWRLVAEVMQEALSTASGEYTLAGIGIASMAETGLLLDRRNGQPVSSLLPWFDQAAAPQAERLACLQDPVQTFQMIGGAYTYKSSLAKVLWWKERCGLNLEYATWLPVAAYIAYRLTGIVAVDPTLAGRTGAFRLEPRDWNLDLLSELGLPRSLFPTVLPSGSPVGAVEADVAEGAGLGLGVQVAICGHDHLVAAFAGGIIGPGAVFDSLGTAETFIGAFPERALTETDAHSGLLFGNHVLPGQMIWLGSLSASGGSLEWLRGLLGQTPLSYQELDALLSTCEPGPGSILYYPYLSGRGSPDPDPAARGAFSGLSLAHTRADLLKAVLEGTGYQMESIRQAAESITGGRIECIRAAGGGTRLPSWMQIKADISGCAYEIMFMPEATLLGAALLAGIGVGLYSSPDEALQAVSASQLETFTPDPARHQAYTSMVEKYEKFASVVREFRSS